MSVPKTPSDDQLCAIKHWFSYCPDSGIVTWRFDHGRGGCKRSAGSRAGRRSSEGYRRLVLNGQDYPEHRAVFFLMLGEWPNELLFVDHINLIKDDNRWSNLRLATRQQNSWNTRPSAANRTGIKGVSFEKRCADRPWVARITVSGKDRLIGRFTTKDEAADAYQRIARRVHRDFAAQ